MNLLSALALLFGASFLAATLIPSQSEWILFWLFSEEKFSPFYLLTAATVGNVLGAIVNWWFGKYLIRFRGRKWFPVSEKDFTKAQIYFQKYGVWALLLAWVPLIGDPITLVSGTMGIRLPIFLPLVTLSKMGRYLFVYAVYLGIF